MDKSKARAIANRAIRPLRSAMALQPWSIDLVWGPIPGDAPDGLCVKGQCTVSDTYSTAIIEIDHNQISSERELLSVLRHEMMHLLNAELTGTLRAQMREATTEPISGVLDTALMHGVERMVWHMEQMLDQGLNMTPKRMIARHKS